VRTTGTRWPTTEDRARVHPGDAADGIYALSQEFKDTASTRARDMFWNPGIDWNAFIDTVRT